MKTIDKRPLALTLFRFAATYAFTLAPYWAKHLLADGHELSCASKRYLDYFDVE